ncbi:hypothetical protein Cadr_000028206, partial [Camelus dromedarius]
YEEEERTGDALLSCRATEVRTQSPSPPWSGPLSYSPCLLIAQPWVAALGTEPTLGQNQGGEIQMCLIKKDCTEVRPPTPLSEHLPGARWLQSLDTA